ncbi:MAG: hypothetical protein LBH32_01215 [Dysgonamonadaceae bacterium]|jgi:hypothetical protein|nr:hypothetical protein [Dysgonamonadaceae bacterium]
MRISLHFQEDESKIGLLRVDYGAGHKNPEIANEFIPKNLTKYTGVQINEPHIHLFFHNNIDIFVHLPLMHEMSILNILWNRLFSS